MATRANIAIVLKPEDQNVPLNFMSDRFKDVRPQVGMDKAEESEIEFTDVIADKPVLQIYNHHDGYPDHLGTVLNKYYNDYEKALALILAGDTSFVDQHNTKAYASRPDEGYESNKPTILDHSRVNEEYLYTFVDGKWEIV
jgi:hypothetical protein